MYVCAWYLPTEEGAGQPVVPTVILLGIIECVTLELECAFTE